jgi:hypothetical protein
VVVWAATQESQWEEGDQDEYVAVGLLMSWLQMARYSKLHKWRRRACWLPTEGIRRLCRD